MQIFRNEKAEGQPVDLYAARQQASGPLPLATLDFENSDNVTHLLVSDFTGMDTDDLDLDDDGVMDTLPWSGVIDGLALVEELTVPPTTTEFHYAGQLGLPIVGPDGSFAPGHAYRLPGGGPFQIGPFEPTSR